MLDWGSLGFHICGTASNGQEALEMAERMHPDLIICDLKMPVMDGIDLIRIAKDRSMNCEFLVISNYEMILIMYELLWFSEPLTIF